IEVAALYQALAPACERCVRLRRLSVRPKRTKVDQGRSEAVMTLPRRQFLQRAAAATACAIPRIAWAQAYPARPVHLIVATTAGATTDIIARLTAQWLSDRLGQQFVVENRPGGGNNIGTEAVVRAPPDGYTLLFVNAVNAINATLFEKLSYNFINDITPIAGFMRVPMVLQVNPSVPARTAPEFIAYAKDNPRN